MRVADYVADYLAELSPRIYGVCGAGAMYLNDAICHHPKLKFIAMHHEQAAAMAAEADARVTGKIGLVSVTAGPGGTNTITGIAGAWVDSIPMLVIAGQVGTSTLKRDSGLRQLGTNELGMVNMVKSITKYAATVLDPKDIQFYLKKAAYLATTGRQGPVWIEIPLDIQSADVDPENLTPWHPVDGPIKSVDVRKVIQLLNGAKRPLIIAGNGVHLANAENELRELVFSHGIPVVTSWNGIDLFPSDSSLVVGRPGIMGDRAGNFAVQNADVILAIGTRLSIPQIGHSRELFAPQATLIVVDIDRDEAHKFATRDGLYIEADAKRFLVELLKVPVGKWCGTEGWMDQYIGWKRQYPVMLPEYRENKTGINSYAFVEELGKQLDDDAIVVTDVGAAFISTMQSLQMRGTQRLFHSGGVSAMGYGIPAAIGACLASGRQTVCLVGDGGAMVNMQELQTIAHHKLPIAIFVFVNNGYLTMQYTQNTHFKREAVSGPESGLSCADFVAVAKAMGIKAMDCRFQGLLALDMDTILSSGEPFVCQIHMPPNQLLMPRVQSKTVDGKFVPVPIQDMWPYLDARELEANMVET